VLAALQAQINTICKNNPMLCQPVKFVFITSQSFDGDLGGLAGADGICQSAASAAGLSGTFKAWLSDGTDSPDTRFNKSPGPYALVTSARIAESYNDLADGSIAAPINLDENGQFVPTTLVWTGTRGDGTSASLPNYCSNWTDNVSTQVTNIQTGRDDRTNAEWTAFQLPVTNPPTTISCADSYRLYCFEQ
jgi:hypothetical protein